MANTSGRVVVDLGVDTVAKLAHLRADGEIKSAAAFIKDVVAEKLADMGANPGIDELVSTYNVLNERGREWLLMCSRIAKESEVTHPTPKRTRTTEADQTL